MMKVCFGSIRCDEVISRNVDYSLIGCSLASILMFGLFG